MGIMGACFKFSLHMGLPPLLNLLIGGGHLVQQLPVLVKIEASAGIFLLDLLRHGQAVTVSPYHCQPSGLGLGWILRPPADVEWAGCTRWYNRYGFRCGTRFPPACPLHPGWQRPLPPPGRRRNSTKPAVDGSGPFSHRARIFAPSNRLTSTPTVKGLFPLDHGNRMEWASVRTVGTPRQSGSSTAAFRWVT